MTKATPQNNTIVFNRKAHFNYFLKDELEGGLVLQGWEVKSLRAGKINLVDAHVIIKRGEAFLLGAQIQPLPTVSTHFIPEISRTRKILFSRKELNSLIGSVEREGYTLIPVSLYWKHNRIKVKVALAKGKKTHDKRDSIKDREWERDRARLLKKHH